MDPSCPHPGVLTGMTEPCGALPRKCLFIYLFVCLFVWMHTPGPTRSPSNGGLCPKRCRDCSNRNHRSLKSGSRCAGKLPAANRSASREILAQGPIGMMVLQDGTSARWGQISPPGNENWDLEEGIVETSRRGRARATKARRNCESKMLVAQFESTRGNLPGPGIL
jgi:hypothetical protein